MFINLYSLGAEENFEGFPKKIVFATYPTLSEAELVMNEFQKHKVYFQLEELAKNNNFNVHILPSGKSSVLVIEPLVNPTIHKEAQKIIKQMFKDAYDVNANGTSESINRSTKSVKKLVKSDVVKVQKNQLNEEEIRLKEQEIKENKIVELKSAEKVKVTNNIFSATELFGSYLLLILGIATTIVIFYLPEFKLIYKKKRNSFIKL
ncbi:MAG: hypothetical protein WC656_03570 [Sulfurimonas sp.]|jgi:hypothetical protein